MCLQVLIILCRYSSMIGWSNLSPYHCPRPPGLQESATWTTSSFTRSRFVFCLFWLQLYDLPIKDHVSKLLHVILKAVTYICQSCYMYLSKFLHVFVKVVTCICQGERVPAVPGGHRRGRGRVRRGGGGGGLNLSNKPATTKPIVKRNETKLL